MKPTLCLVAAFVGGPALAQSAASGKVTDLQLATARAAAISSLSSIPGSTSFSNPEKAVEGIQLRYLVYEKAIDAILARDNLCKAAAGHDVATGNPILVFGSTPPSIAQWTLFEENRRRIADGLAQAATDYADAKKIPAPAAVPSEKYIAVIGALPIFEAALGLTKTDVTESGASIKSADTEFAALVNQEVSRTCAPDVSDLTIEDDAGNAKSLIEDWAYKGTRIADLYDQARQIISTEYNVEVANANGDPKGIKNKQLVAAAQNLQTMIASYEDLRKSVYVEVNGKSAATMLLHQEALSTWSSSHTRPILYFLSHDAALDTRLNKGVTAIFTGPGDLSALAVVSYALVTTPTGVKRDTISCQTKAMKLSHGHLTDAGWACSTGGDPKPLSKDQQQRRN